MCLKTFGERAGGSWHGGLALKEATGFVCDARQVRSGEVFVAFEGRVHDGHAFLEQARQRGALAAVVRRVDPNVDLPQLAVEDPLSALREAARQHRKTFQGPLVAITGSCGKTSTKDLLHELLGPKQTHVNQLNFNGQIGVPLTLLGLDPEVHRFAVIEAGISKPAEMDVLEELIVPDHVILTCIAPAHLEFLRSEAMIAQEKAKLARRVRGRVVLHKEDLRYPALQALAAHAWVAEPCESPKLNTLGYHINNHASGAQLSLWLPSGEPHCFELGWMSRGQQRNTVLALALALDLGLDASLLQEHLALWQPSPKRGELHTFPEKTIFLDAYNASPASMADALDFFHKRFASPHPRLYLVGSMAELGQRVDAAHQTLGQQLQLRPQDTAWLIGAHAEAIRAGIGPTQATVHVQSELDVPVLQKAVQAFRGSVFIKGSYSLDLERCMP